MATLAGNTIASTYPLLLKIDSSGIDATLRAVEDGDATDSALLLATNKVEVKPGSNDTNAFEVSQADGTAVFTVDTSNTIATINGNLSVTGSDATDQVVITNTDGGTGTAPDLVLYRNSASPADNDYIGQILMRGRNDNSQDVSYVEIDGIITDASDGTEDASLTIFTMAAGSQVNTMTLASGQVGIGTASPSKPLHVSSADNQVALFESTDAYAGIELKDNGSSTLPPLISALSDDILFYGGHGSSRPLIMTLDSSTANVGIGTSSPASMLHLSSNNGPELTLSDANAGSNVKNYGIYSDSGLLGFRRKDDSHSGYSPTMVINQDKLGIGTTSPDNLLHIKTTGSTPSIELEQDAGTSYKALFKLAGNDLEIRGSSGTIEFFTGNNDGDSSTERMRITSGGFVGIGDTTPDAHLEVSNETVNPDGSSFTGFFSNHIITTGSYDSSDSFFGTRNHLEVNQSGMGFGSMYGIYNSNQCALASGQMTQVTGISNSNSFEAGDVDYMRGILNFNNFDGGEIDNNIVTLYNLTEIASGGTIRGSVYGIENDHDADTNPAGEMLGYYGIARSNADYHMKLYSATQSSLVMRWHDNGAIDHENAITSGASLDYAEYFESKDGKAIVIGTTVKLDDGKIVACEDGDTPIGVVRPLHTSAVVGGSQPFHWQGMYETDDYGGYVMESFSWTKWEKEVDYDTYRSANIGDGGVLGGTIKKECYEQQDGSKKYEIIYRFHTDRIPSDLTVPSDARIIEDKNKRKKINSDYDHSKADSYKGREERDEWHIVGLLGQIQITKGQPLSSNWIKMKDVSDTVELYFVK